MGVSSRFTSYSALVRTKSTELISILNKGMHLAIACGSDCLYIKLMARIHGRPWYHPFTIVYRMHALASGLDQEEE